MIDIERIINNRRIVVYGLGDMASRFCNKFSGLIKISACTCTGEGFEPIKGGGAPVHYSSLSAEKDYIIICTDIYYNEIARSLYLRGFHSIEDFIRFDYFEKLYDAQVYGKALIVGIGQCEIDEILFGLTQVKAVNRDYVVIGFEERSCMPYGDRFCIECYEDCIGIIENFYIEIFIQAMVFMGIKQNEYSRIRSLLSKDTKVIYAPLFEFDGYWPQDISKEREVSKYYCEWGNRKIDAYASRDREIEKMIDSGMGTEEIYNRVISNNYFDKDVVRKNHEKSMRRARLSERKASFEISDYVEDMYKKIKLYCDRGHFNENLLLEYIIRIVRCIGLSMEKDFDSRKLQAGYERVNEFPIYPSTGECLGLDFVDENTKYRVVYYDGVSFLNFEEYILNIIEFYRGSRNNLMLCNIDFAGG